MFFDDSETEMYLKEKKIHKNSPDQYDEKND